MVSLVQAVTPVTHHSTCVPGLGKLHLSLLRLNFQQSGKSATGVQRKAVTVTRTPNWTTPSCQYGLALIWL